MWEQLLRWDISVKEPGIWLQPWEVSTGGQEVELVAAGGRSLQRVGVERSAW